MKKFNLLRDRRFEAILEKWRKMWDRPRGEAVWFVDPNAEAHLLEAMKRLDTASSAGIDSR